MAAPAQTARAAPITQARSFQIPGAGHVGYVGLGRGQWNERRFHRRGRHLQRRPIDARQRNDHRADGDRRAGGHGGHGGFGGNGGNGSGGVDYDRDAQGHIQYYQKVDQNGQPVFDDHGNPVPDHNRPILEALGNPGNPGGDAGAGGNAASGGDGGTAVAASTMPPALT